jgi:hypothetical protein
MQNARRKDSRKEQPQQHIDNERFTRNADLSVAGASDF